MVIPKKVTLDQQVIDSAFKKILESENEKMEIHLIYAGDTYWYEDDRLRLFIFEEIKKYNITKVMVTKIDMWRNDLITKEKMENYCKEESTKGSVTDDLESLFADLRLGKEPNFKVTSYFGWSYFE